MTHHRLVATASPAGLLFECADGCGRRLVIDRLDGAMTTIDRGDPAALHSGGLAGVS